MSGELFFVRSSGETTITTTMDGKQFLLWKSQNGYIMNEKQFLITMAIRRYNEQYGRDIRPEDCDVRSIPTRQRYDRSYEIRTNRGDDFVQIHIHIEFGDIDALRPYRLETEGHGLGNLEDEVFVATGKIDRYYKNQGVYKFRPLEYDDYLLNILLMEDGTPLLMESGGHILLE